jgi:trehalose 6-phosphate phosphatase
MSVIIDPRHHDAVLFERAGLATDATLSARLRDAGIRADTLDPHAPTDPTLFVRAANRLGLRPDRCAVLATSTAGVVASRAGGFALVIGVEADGNGAQLRRHGADAVVSGPDEVNVATGYRRMSQLPDGLQALDVVTAAHPAVFFDFDGTLCDIVSRPDAARLAEGTAEVLTALAAHCPVAVLSGRDLADVRQRIGLPGIWYAGSHGFELTGPDGAHHQNEAAAASIPLLEQTAAELGGRLGHIAGVMVEHKRFGVAVHYRNAARDRVGEVTAAVRAAGQRSALRVTTGREVIELRPNVDWDKGKTLHWVLDHISGSAGPPWLPVYLGDDITDEDAFDAVRDFGVGIVVRHNDDGDRATAARYALDNPDRVREFTSLLAGRLAD